MERVTVSLVFTIILTMHFFVARLSPFGGFVHAFEGRGSRPGRLVLERTSGKLPPACKWNKQNIAAPWTNIYSISWPIATPRFPIGCPILPRVWRVGARLWSFMSMDRHRDWAKEYVGFQVICRQCQYFVLYQHWHPYMGAIERLGKWWRRMISLRGKWLTSGAGLFKRIPTIRIKA